MVEISIDEFHEERECCFEGEVYSVRDNGAVFRHSKKDGRTRSADNKWTFGKENSQNPYLCISGARVHRIVATAFHGEPPNTNYVVDHLDTNCRNNRPENLKWCTRLENALNNAVTRKKIEFLCGSIESFLENPRILDNLKYDSSISWMRTVTPEEAHNCRMHMALWANTKKTDQHKTDTVNYKKAFNDRVLRPLQKWEAGLSGEPGLDFAKTPWCGQYMWSTDVCFPCCPEQNGKNPINEYFRNIQKGKVFAYSEKNTFPKLVVHEANLYNNDLLISVICERDDSAWTVVGILLNEKKHFIHFNLGSFLKIEKAYAFSQSIKDENDLWSKGYSRKWDPQ